MRFGTSRFLLLYIGGGIVSGLVALLFLFLFSSSAVVVGSTPAVFALLTAWMMLYPNLDFHLFIFLRLKAKWLVGIIFGLSLLSTLLHGAYFSLVAELTGILWGLIIGWTVFKTKPYRSPIQKQRRNVWADFPAKKHTSSAKEKVIDISSFQQEDDDAFMDRMLDKISREGQLSLTQKEKKRMQDISRKKHL